MNGFERFLKGFFTRYETLRISFFTIFSLNPHFHFISPDLPQTLQNLINTSLTLAVLQLVPNLLSKEQLCDNFLNLTLILGRLHNTFILNVSATRALKNTLFDHFNHKHRLFRQLFFQQRQTSFSEFFGLGQPRFNFSVMFFVFCVDLSCEC